MKYRGIECAKQQRAEQLAQLATHPAWVEYVKNELAQMEADPSGLWVGVTEKSRQEWRRLNETPHLPIQKLA